MKSERSTNTMLSLHGALLAIVIFLFAPSATAQRVSISALDAKLDQLLGQAANFDSADHVGLRLSFTAGSDCSEDRVFVRVHPDGLVDSAEFVVPSDKVLILTDISWQAGTQPTSFIPGRTLTMTLVTLPQTGTNSTLVWRSSPVEITTANANARLGGSETLRSGIAVGPNRRVCGDASNSSQTGSASNSLLSAHLNGVLIPVTP